MRLPPRRRRRSRLGHGLWLRLERRLLLRLHCLWRRQLVRILNVARLRLLRRLLERLLLQLAERPEQRVALLAHGEQLLLLGAQLLLEVLELGAVERLGVRAHARHLALERALRHRALGELALEGAHLALELVAARLLRQLGAAPRVLGGAARARRLRLEAPQQLRRLASRRRHRRRPLLLRELLGTPQRALRLVARRAQRRLRPVALLGRLRLHRPDDHPQLRRPLPLRARGGARRLRRAALLLALPLVCGAQHRQLLLVRRARRRGRGCGRRVLRVELVLMLGPQLVEIGSLLPLLACGVRRLRLRLGLSLEQQPLPVRRARLRLVDARRQQLHARRVAPRRVGVR